MAQRNRNTPLKPCKSRAILAIIHPNAAGIDMGSASHFVAVPPDRDDEPVREFPSFTVDLKEALIKSASGMKRQAHAAHALRHNNRLGEGRRTA